MKVEAGAWESTKANHYFPNINAVRLQNQDLEKEAFEYFNQEYLKRNLSDKTFPKIYHGEARLTFLPPLPQPSLWQVSTVSGVLSFYMNWDASNASFAQVRYAMWQIDKTGDEKWKLVSSAGKDNKSAGSHTSIEDHESISKCTIFSFWFVVESLSSVSTSIVDLISNIQIQGLRMNFHG